ncbi:MAG: hypothetical protein EBZ44_02090 [Verrucomicrobia bacterium]|nr:hypothetical protein [Verrucomicrobiota bacterium]NDD56503.1 hypothetical protein [Verrucomicrobiota bacterium]
MSDKSHTLSERSHPYLPGLWLAAGFLGLASLAFLLRPAGVTPDTILEKAAMERWDKLQKLKTEQTKDATSYGWIDKDKGIARIPVEKAMELTARKLRAEDPRPAYPITTIAPSAITAAGYPLYPEVPVDTAAVAMANAADGASMAATNKVPAAPAKPAPAATTNNPVKK